MLNVKYLAMHTVQMHAGATSKLILYCFASVRAITHLLKLVDYLYVSTNKNKIEPVHEISNNLICATSKASDQPAHMRSLIRAFASRLSIL